ncbi:hypothetical protein T265_04954 [Opisthorchis viverrini]|uniref:Uncharacterized protein n=1 Tax=Opisthorchis viverrini TaxID=6198 RepID=A0A074ZQX3_OPIVI|nr:hypothetical protein T265_04954 [Opisthorchis viverrini]KER28202.1 hypothetical protein T265_04954 [Opisthorchis viverrini]
MATDLRDARPSSSSLLLSTATGPRSTRLRALRHSPEVSATDSSSSTSDFPRVVDATEFTLEHDIHDMTRGTFDHETS